jgi:PAS domain S-box-containing protein
MAVSTSLAAVPLFLLFAWGSARFPLKFMPLELTLNAKDVTTGRTLQIFGMKFPLTPTYRYPIWRVVSAALLPVAWWWLITAMYGQPVRQAFILMMLPVLLASWWGGLYAGLVASILALIGGWDLASNSPFMTWTSPGAPINRISAIMLLVVGALVTFSQEMIRVRGVRLLVAQRAAREADQRLVSQAPVALAMFDTQMRYLATSAYWKSSLGLAADVDLMGVSHYEALPELPERWRVLHQQGLAGETVSGREERFERANGAVQFLNWQCKPWCASDGSLGGIILWIEDVTQTVEARKAVEAELQRTRDVLVAAQQIGQVGSFSYAPRPNILDWSAEEKRIHGLEPDGPSPTLEAAIELIMPEDRAPMRANVEKLLQSKGTGVWDYRIVRPNGSLRILSSRAECKLYERGEVQYVIGTTQDITDRKTAEEKLRRALAERTTLLDEVHHRVKNNLAMLTGLLWLQRQQSSNAETIQQLQVSHDRIAAIALVHEKLYQDGHFDSIDFKTYLEQLCQSVMDSSGAGTRGISYRVTGENFPLTLTEAVPCSLLLNELVSNSLKHAFPGGRTGRMWVDLSIESDGSRLVRFGDDGVGVAQGGKRDDSLGLKLVNRLANQLGASLKLEATAVGTLYSLRLQSPKQGT